MSEEIKPCPMKFDVSFHCKICGSWFCDAYCSGNRFKPSIRKMLIYKFRQWAYEKLFKSKEGSED